MSLKNPGLAITNIGNFTTEKVQLGTCALVFYMKICCGLCKKKMYPATFQNEITQEVRKGFICFRCGDSKLIDDLVRSRGDCN